VSDRLSIISSEKYARNAKKGQVSSDDHIQGERESDSYSDVCEWPRVRRR
jgi:hypothetical protein